MFGVNRTLTPTLTLTLNQTHPNHNLPLPNPNLALPNPKPNATSYPPSEIFVAHCVSRAESLTDSKLATVVFDALSRGLPGTRIYLAVPSADQGETTYMEYDGTKVQYVSYMRKTGLLTST